MSVIDLETRRTAREAARAAEKEAKDKAKQAAKDAEKEALREAAAEAEAGIRSYLRHDLLARHDLHYISGLDAFVEFFGSGLNRKHHIIKAPAVRMLDYSNLRSSDIFALLMDIMQEDGRCWRRVDMTFAQAEPDTLNLLSADFLPEAAGEPHPIFDALLANLAAGCPAAQAHIEQLVLAKWRNPANYLLPALCLHDPVGGSGKSLFVSGPLTAAFGARSVADNISMGDISARFTAQIAGQAVWFINESVEDKCDDEAVKRLLHSKTLWVEQKNLPKYEVANTALCIIAGNSPMGSIRVSNSSVDRRYSVIRTGGALVERVRREFGMPDNEAARKWIAGEGVKLLSDPVQVGRWLRVLRERHGDVTDVPAFHGKDYAALVKAQRPFHESVFEAVFRDPAFEYVRKPLLYRLYADLCRAFNNGYGLLRNRSFYAQLEVWAEREGVRLGERNAPWKTRDLLGEPKSTTADVIYAEGTAAAAGKLKCNDSRYGTEDNGRWQWSVQPA
jgi:hypothetical protein